MQQGKVVQINRSRGGLPKLPVNEEVYVSERGVDGDDWIHKRFHGGPTRALLVIAQETLDELRPLGYDLFPGALGENLSVRGLDRRLWRSGQRFRAGGVVFEFTKLRQPCESLTPYGRGIQATLYDKACKAGDPTSPVWARGGFYASIVQPGMIRVGDIIALED